MLRTGQTHRQMGRQVPSTKGRAGFPLLFSMKIFFKYIMDRYEVNFWLLVGNEETPLPSATPPAPGPAPVLTAT